MKINCCIQHVFRVEYLALKNSVLIAKLPQPQKILHHLSKGSKEKLVQLTSQELSEPLGFAAHMKILLSSLAQALHFWILPRKLSLVAKNFPKGVGILEF